MQKGSLLLRVLLVVAVGLGVMVVASYKLSLEQSVANMVETELPLTGDSVYSEIQKDLIRPVLVSAEMAHDTFLRDWVLAGEVDSSKVAHYLDMIRQKHELASCFFVSAITEKYYYPGGILKHVAPSSLIDKWFYRVATMEQEYEINVDPDAANNDSLTVFVNYKVYDYRGNFIGATGLGLPLAGVLTVMERYDVKFKRRVFLVDRRGNIIVQSGGASVMQGNIFSQPGIMEIADKIVGSGGAASEKLKYTSVQGRITRVNSRFIPELGWHLIVEKEEQFSDGFVIAILQTGIITSLAILGIIAFIYAQARKEYARQLAHKGGILAVVSHDLKHFVHTMHSLVSLASHAQDRGKESWAIREMERVVDGLSELTSRFLSYYRLDSGADTPHFVATKLSTLLAQLLSETEPQLVAGSRRLLFQTDDDHWIYSDPVLLKIILRNFLSNAIKYASAGDIHVVISKSRRQGRVILSVLDEGDSLEKEDARHIFGRFVRKPSSEVKSGDGLGLFLVSCYARKIHCRVGFSPRVPKGSCFWISVPLASKREVSKATTSANAVEDLMSHVERPLSGATIAVVGDDQALNTLLKRWGAQIQLLESIKVALSDPVRLGDATMILVADYEMCQSEKAAYSLSSLCVAICDKLPVLVLTTRAEEEISDVGRLQNVRFIMKPVTPAKLRKILVRMLNAD